MQNLAPWAKFSPYTTTTLKSQSRRHCLNMRTKLLSAVSGDGVRWGDRPDSTSIERLRKNRLEFRWFDGEAACRPVVQLSADEMFAPAFVLRNRQRFDYMLRHEAEV